MSDWNDEVRNALELGDPVFRTLYDEHHELESRVAELTAKPIATFDEEVEEKRLKKSKLAIKDQMAGHLRSMSMSRSA